MPRPARPSAFLSILLFVAGLVTGLPARAVEVPGLPGGPLVSPIIGGTPAAGEQPWMVAFVRVTTRTGLTPGQLQFCGGVLIDPSWVLTAAHCIDDETPATLQAIVGRADLNGGGGELLEVAELIPHPRYGSADTYDIGLVRLKTPAAAAPVALADLDLEERLRSEPLALYGWGFQTYRSEYACSTTVFLPSITPGDFRCGVFVFSHGANPSRLLEGRARIHPFAECERRFRDYRVRNGLYVSAKPYFGADVTPDVLCIWDNANSASVCYGDSGGPLIGTGPAGPVVLGVASYITLGECPSPDQIAAYTSVAFFSDFIAATLERTPELGFAGLCPAQPVLTKTGQAAADGGQQVTLAWPADARARGYRLYFAATTGDRGIRRLDLPADQHALTTTLRSGQKYRVVLQAGGEACDSPMSAMLTVAAP